MKRLLFFLACCAPFFCSASEIGQITTRLDNGSLHFSLNQAELKKAMKKGTYIWEADNGRAFVKSVKIEGYAKGAFKETIGGLKAIGSSKVSSMKVAGIAIARRAVWVEVAYQIGDPLIKAGFRKFGEQDETTRGHDWWKHTKDGMLYCGLGYADAPFSANCFSCLKKEYPCMVGDSPNAASYSGIAAWVVNGWCAQNYDDSPKTCRASIHEIVYPWSPASDGELTKGLDDFMGAGTSWGLANTLENNGYNLDGSNNFSLAPNQYATSSPYTPAGSNSAQQTTVTTDANGNASISYTQRPDLPPNSTEAPTLDHSPVTPEEAAQNNVTGSGSGGDVNVNVEVDLCSKNPNVIACQDVNVPDGEIPRDTVDLPEITDESRFSLPKSCPAPVSVNVWGQTLSFSYQPLCDWMRVIEPLMVCFGAITAFFVLSKGN